MKHSHIATYARFIAASLAASALVGQTVITVPGMHPTIGAAISAAQFLPQPVTIEVSPGTYFESLTIGLDGLVIKRAPSGVGDVVVQPPLGSHAIDFPGSSFISRATRVERITMRGQYNPFSVSLVLIQGQSPTFVECKILDNEAVFGAGVWIQPPSPAAAPSVVGPLFIDCDIAGNVATDGGGAEIEWHSRFENCRITGNNAYARGAGIFVASSLELNYDVDLIACVVSDNGQAVLSSEGGAFYTLVPNAAVRWFGCRLEGNRAGVGGAGVSNGRGLQMDHCVVIGNTATLGEGGGVVIQTGFDQSGNERPTRAVLTSTKFLQNSAETMGGAILIRRSDTEAAATVMAELFASNCLIANNNATSAQAGGLYVERANALLAKTTVANNEASSAGGRGIYLATGSFVGASTCILWGNQGTQQRNQIAGVAGSGIAVIYSDVQSSSGVFPGIGNINLAPLFVMVFGVPENSYYLQASSPCINTGDPASSPDGSESVLSSLAPDTGILDMGYHRAANPASAVVFP